jgi:chromosome segregation ATPase
VNQEQFIINFLAAGFQQSFDELETELVKRFNELSVQLTNLLDSRTMALLDQINELKNSDSVNAAKLDGLTATILNEREQVLGLVTLSQSQQEAIVQKDARIAELLAQLAAGTADLETASAEINNLIAKSAEESAKIDAAIAGIQDIYNVPVQPPVEEPVEPPVEEPQPPVEPPSDF